MNNNGKLVWECERGVEVEVGPEVRQGVMLAVALAVAVAAGMELRMGLTVGGGVAGKGKLSGSRPSRLMVGFPSQPNKMVKHLKHVVKPRPNL